MLFDSRTVYLGASRDKYGQYGRRERLRQCNGDSDSTEVDGIYPEEESM